MAFSMPARIIGDGKLQRREPFARSVCVECVSLNVVNSVAKLLNVLSVVLSGVRL